MVVKWTLHASWRECWTCNSGQSTRRQWDCMLHLQWPFWLCADINAVCHLFGCLVQQASSMRNFMLSCLPWMLSEDLKKNTFSYSNSSLIALGRSYVDHDTIYKYLKTYSTFTNAGKTVILCSIPSHVEIPGNERADRVEKAALSLPISPLKISVTDFLPRAKLLMRRKWQEGVIYVAGHPLLNRSCTRLAWCIHSPKT